MCRCQSQNRAHKRDGAGSYDENDNAVVGKKHGVHHGPPLLLSNSPKACPSLCPGLCLFTHPNNSGTAYVFHPTYAEPEKFTVRLTSGISTSSSGGAHWGRANFDKSLNVGSGCSFRAIQARRDASAAALRSSSDMRSISSSSRRSSVAAGSTSSFIPTTDHCITLRSAAQCL